jgi:hypothetical protein
MNTLTAWAALEAARKSGGRVRVWYGSETGRSFEEEWDTIGRVGRSTGGHLILLKTSRSTGGVGLMPDIIVKVVRTADGATMYRHPSFYQPTYSILPCNTNGLKFRVVGDSITVARFRTRESAERWVDFMLGRRNTKAGRR